MSTKQLPDKLSELIYIALEDLEKIEADPRYIIDMGTWHMPNGKCAVCAAGAVMAKRLGADPTAHISPSRFDDDTEAKLDAIDLLRCGYLDDAADQLGFALPSTLAPDYCEYVRESVGTLSAQDETRDEWKMHMTALIGILQAEGL